MGIVFFLDIFLKILMIFNCLYIYYILIYTYLNKTSIKVHTKKYFISKYEIIR